MMIVAGTGHRPTKLGGYSPQAFDRLVALAEGWLTDNRPSKVISGMALGWDMALAQASINLGIPFVAAVPFHGQEGNWPMTSRISYHKLLEKSESTIVVSPGGYAAFKMQKRNEWMVDNCDTLLALWNGSAGGTFNCIRYAKSVPGVRIVNLYPEFIQS